MIETTLEEIVGTEIIGAGFANSNEYRNIPVLVVQVARNTFRTLFVMSDAEGNGTGWVHIYDLDLVEGEYLASRSKASLANLMGSKIVDTGLNDEDDLKDIPTIAVQLATGDLKALMIMCDPEGNGAGWLDSRKFRLAQDGIHPTFQHSK